MTRKCCVTVSLIRSLLLIRTCSSSLNSARIKFHRWLLPPCCIAKSWLHSINSSLNKQPCFIFPLLSSATSLAGRATSSATRQGGVEEPSVKVSVSLFVYLEAATRSNKTTVWYISSTKALFKRRPVLHELFYYVAAVQPFFMPASKQHTYDDLIQRCVWNTCLSDSSVVTCDTPAEVANGRSSWDSEDVPAYGEIINYTCDEGYTLVGKDSIVCSETGEYDSQPPECKGKHHPAAAFCSRWWWCRLGWPSLMHIKYCWSIWGPDGSLCMFDPPVLGFASLQTIFKPFSKFVGRFPVFPAAAAFIHSFISLQHENRLAACPGWCVQGHSDKYVRVRQWIAAEVRFLKIKPRTRPQDHLNYIFSVIKNIAARLLALKPHKSAGRELWMPEWGTF